MPRFAVCGGVYANPYALRAMLADARARGCGRVVCLGDLGGFGADPDSIWPLLEGVECIAGNYDLAIASGAEDCGCGYSDPRDDHYAQVMYDHTRAHTSPAFAAWMGGLPHEWRETVAGLDVHMVHGSPLEVNDFLWESLPDEALAERVAASGADVLLCTHTGLPWQRRVGGTLVVNVGAVGRPANDGRTEGWYAVLDVEPGRARAELLPVAYDACAQAAGLRAAGLPEAFAVTVETGWWTTCLEVVPPPERARGRYHLYRDAVPVAFAAPGVGWAPPPEDPGDALPVVPLFGTAAFPPRLWLYTNFHCNLSCGYCAVASSPAARPRSLGRARAAALVEEAVDEGFTALFVTGGEPFLEPDLAAILAHAAARLPTTVLTNAMLFRGRRARELEALAGLPGLTLQVSLDGARAGTHDAERGPGSFTRTVEGIAHATGLGLRVRVSTTETRGNAGELAAMGPLLAGLGVAPEDHAVRPLVARGLSAEGIAVGEAGLVPELTVTADGVHWHPVGADIETSPDLLVGRGPLSLADAKRRVTERFLTLRQRDGSLPTALACAIA